MKALPLSVADAPRIDALYQHCLDYHLMADGEPAAPDAGREAFSDVPPGHDPAQLLLLGMTGADGRLEVLAQTLRGYPAQGVWWIGLMLVAPEARGGGLGRAMLEDILTRALAAEAQELQLGVLDVNQDARRFWEREGFVWLRTTEPRQFGQRKHIVHVLRRPLPALPGRL